MGGNAAPHGRNNVVEQQSLRQPVGIRIVVVTGKVNDDQAQGGNDEDTLLSVSNGCSFQVDPHAAKGHLIGSGHGVAYLRGGKDGRLVRTGAKNIYRSFGIGGRYRRWLTACGADHLNYYKSIS